VAVKKNNRIDFRFNLSYSQENFTDEPGILWTLNADTGLITRPYLFKNHIIKGNELVYQDQGNDLYLQSVTGKVMWKKKISEPVESEIFTVDAFKNGKFQMLFSTANYLHLIDRNGNYVQGYPVKLPAKASSALSVLDYENKNELRLFIACADKKIYNYSIYGVKQEGFKPPATMSEVELPVKYCRVGPSDYLITADKKGRIYAFSRRGDGRIDFKNKLIENAADFEMEQGNLLSNSHIVYYDAKERLINKVSLTDKKEAFKTPEIGNAPAVCYGDFDHNKTTDILLASEMKLEAYNFNGTRIFAADASGSLRPSHLNFWRNGNRSFICSWDNESNTAGVYDVEEKTSHEFKASEPLLICDLFNDGKTYLLIVNGSEIKCLKL
jgi:outer membrane protein assembly factor BamB